MEGGGTSAARMFTVMRADASCVPPGPFAISVYVLDLSGVIVLEPDAITLPMSSMAMSVALFVCHVNVVDWPCSITAGFAAKVAVGTGGGGGAGGVACAAFLLQPENDNAPAKIAASVNQFHVRCFT